MGSQEIRVSQMGRGHLQRPSKCVLLTPKLKKGRACENRYYCDLRDRGKEYIIFYHM
jgi:hypothetical protein